MSNFAPKMYTILIIEDDQRLASLLQTGIEEGGHGIGMALVQRIMVLHNASIDVQSKEGHGTKFIISFTN